jgi:hypothetical protein
MRGCCRYAFTRVANRSFLEALYGVFLGGATLVFIAATIRRRRQGRRLLRSECSDTVTMSCVMRCTDYVDHTRTPLCPCFSASFTVALCLGRESECRVSLQRTSAWGRALPLDNAIYRDSSWKNFHRYRLYVRDTRWNGIQL